MLRFVPAAVTLAGMLAATQPVFANLCAATGSDHRQAAAPATAQPAQPSVVWSSSSNAQAPTDAGLGKNIPVGFGWG